MYNMQDAGVQLFLEGQSLFDLVRKQIVMKKKQSKNFEELDGLILAQEIDIKEAELSLFINNHYKIGDTSNNNIPANWWYKLIEKEKEHLIATNRELRKEQKKYVHRTLEVKV